MAADTDKLMLDDDDALPVEDAPETPDKAADLDDVIGKALDGSDADDQPSEGRERDEKGRFKAKTEDSDPAEAPDPGPSEAPAVASSEQPEQKPQPVELTDGHFRGWSPEQRQAFQALAPEAQKVALEVIQGRDRFYADRIAASEQYQQAVTPLIQAVDQHYDRIQAMGATPDQYVAHVLNIDRMLALGTYEQKTKLLGELAQSIGVPISIQQPDEWADPLQPGGQAYPVIHDLKTQVTTLQQQLNQYRSQIDTTEHQRTSSTLQSFAATTNPDGSPKYPYFDTVRATMGQLMASGAAQTLEDAYSKASAPIVKQIEAQAQRLHAETEARRKAAVEKAKKARPIKTTASSPNGHAKPGNLDAILGDALQGWGE